MPARKKETLVRYLNIAQRLVVGIKAYVDSFEEIDDYLIRLQELSNEGYLIITKANNIVVEDIISYIDRTELLIKGFSLYKSLTEYLEVIVQVKNIEKLLKAIRLECEKLHLTINEKKTYIVPINKGFTFLKSEFF